MGFEMGYFQWRLLQERVRQLSMNNTGMEEQQRIVTYYSEKEG